MALAFDATSQLQWIETSPQTFTHVNGTGADRYMFITVGDDRDGVVNDGAVSYNSVNCPRVAIYDDGGGRPTQRVFALVAPATGSNTVSITIDTDAKTQMNSMVTSYTGVDQTTPIGTFVTGTGTTPATINVTGTTAGNLVVDFMTCEDPLADPTVGASQTARHVQGAVGDEMEAGVSDEAAGGTITMSWTVTAAITWVSGAVELAAAAGGGGGLSIPVAMASYRQHHQSVV